MFSVTAPHMPMGKGTCEGALSMHLPVIFPAALLPSFLPDRLLTASWRISFKLHPRCAGLASPFPQPYSCMYTWKWWSSGSPQFWLLKVLASSILGHGPLVLKQPFAVAFACPAARCLEVIKMLAWRACAMGMLRLSLLDAMQA